MTRDELRDFLRRHLLAVVSSVAEDGAPQAAVVGVVINDRCELFFDTLQSSRKCQNLRRDPRIALVLGWDLDEACTAQIEGRADEPNGDELARWKELYFATFPDGVERQAWPGITYFRVRPSWARFSDFRPAEARIVELDSAAFRADPLQGSADAGAAGLTSGFRR